MRVCMVAYTFYEHDNRVMRYSEALVARGDVVDVIALRLPHQAWFARYRGVNLYRIQMRVPVERTGRFNYLFRLTRFLLRSSIFLSWMHLKRSYSIVHVHSVPDFEVFSALVPKILGAKIILDIHDLVPEFYCSKFRVGTGSIMFRVLLLVERLSIRFSQHVIIANHLWKSRLVRRSVAKEKCTAILNYPDPSIFYPRRRKRKDKRFIYLYPGTINYHQGVDIAVKAFALIQDLIIGGQLWVYGEGPDKRFVEKMVCELGLCHRVFLFDAVPITKIPEIMVEADVAVVPKRSNSFGDEAFSTKSLEFMNMGIPLIISNTRIDRHDFNERVVRFFESGDENDLARQMLFLYENQEARACLSVAAKLFVEEFSWGKKKEEYLSLIDKLCHSGKRELNQMKVVHEKEKRRRLGFICEIDQKLRLLIFGQIKICTEKKKAIADKTDNIEKFGVQRGEFCTVRSGTVAAMSAKKEGLRTKVYYLLKPIIPRRLQIMVRRRFVVSKLPHVNGIWPIDPCAGESPDHWNGWPGQKKFALVLTHDVESERGVQRCLRVASIENELDFRSSFNFVPEKYRFSTILRTELEKLGFEVGAHDLRHDGKLYKTERIFRERAHIINRYLDEWGVVGFRSGFMRHNLDWLCNLQIDYDSSTFDTDPFEPQPDGICSIFPVWVQREQQHRGYVELPYTLPQDITIFILLKNGDSSIWKEKLDWIVDKGGMALLDTHPDYMCWERGENES